MENNKKNRNRAITAEIFACVKILIANGASRAEAAKYMKIGISTVDRIISAETYEEYKNILAAMNAKYHETYREKRLTKKEEPVQEEKPEPVKEEKQEPAPQVVEHRQNVTIQTTYYVSQKLDAMTDLLNGISAKLACIIDDLYGTNTKKEA